MWFLLSSPVMSVFPIVAVMLRRTASPLEFVLDFLLFLFRVLFPTAVRLRKYSDNAENRWKESKCRCLPWKCFPRFRGTNCISDIRSGRSQQLPIFPVGSSPYRW